MVQFSKDDHQHNAPIEDIPECTKNLCKNQVRPIDLSLYSGTISVETRLTVSRTTLNEEQPPMTVEARIMSHSELTAAIVAACTKALKAGMSQEDVAAVLARVQELIEAGDAE